VSHETQNLEQRLLAAVASENWHIVFQVFEIIRRQSTQIKLIEEQYQALDQSLVKAKARARALKSQIAGLKRQIAKLNKMTFGPKADRNPESQQNSNISEGSDQVNGKMAMVEVPPVDQPPEPLPKSPADCKSEPTKNRNLSGRGKRKFPSHLDRKEIYMGTPDRKCPCGCGGGIIGFDVNETLEVVPASYFVAARQYPKYRCRLEDRVIGTKFEPRIFQKTTISNSILASALSMRFAWYLPWYRQEQMFISQGIDLKRETLLRAANRTTNEALQPIFELLEAEVKQNSTRLFMDETTLPKLQPGMGKTKTSYLYAVLRDDSSFGGNLPPAVIYYARNSRAMYHIHDILAGVDASVQTDAYAGYGQLGKASTVVENIAPVKCWAHVRRHFTDEFEFNQTPDARTVIEMIAELYKEEALIKGKPPAARVAHRTVFSLPILVRLRAFLSEAKDRTLSRSSMQKAIAYVENIWVDLTKFIDDGRLDLDTNAVERMFKPIILLRKNALFIGSDEGAEAWSIMSSLAETCRLNGINFEPYLKWVLDEIASRRPRSEYHQLLPWNAPGDLRILG